MRYCAQMAVMPLLASVVFWSQGLEAAEQDSGSGAPTAQTVELVTITATLRPTPLLELPASSTVYAADRLAAANVTTPKQLVSLAPGLGVINSIGESFGQLVRVRGVATSGADIGLESAVGVTIDGVPLSRPNLAILDLQGVERVELLRGPQGTLFGRNTTAGVLNVVTERPSFTRRFEASSGAASRDGWEVRTMAEGTIVESVLAGRLDALAGSSDGYTRNVTTRQVYGGRDRQQLRGQLLWVPSSSLQIRLIADYLRHEGTTNGPVYRVVGPTGAIIESLSGLPFSGSAQASDVTQIDNDGPRHEESKIAGLTAQANWQTNLGEVTAVTSYRNAEAARSYDVDNSPADLANDPRDGERFNSFTYEMRLQGERGRLDYLIGAFFGREIITSRDNFLLGSDVELYANALSGGFIPLFTGLPLGENFPAGAGVFDVFRQRTTSAALFSHHIVALSDRLSLTLGGRYTHQKKSIAADISSNNPACDAAISNFGPELTGVPLSLQGLICIPNLDPRYDGKFRASSSEDNGSGTVALSHQFGEMFSAYAQYSRGYKGGGYQLDRSVMDPLAPALSEIAFDAETADSFELGARAYSQDGIWHISASLFHTSFNDYQFSFFTGINRRTQNVPELVTKGFEVEAALRPVPFLEFTLATSYQEVIFGKSGFPAGLTQLQGSTSPIAPRWVVVGTVSYGQEIGNLGLNLFGNANLRWQSRTNVGASATPTPDFIQESYAVAGARIGVSGRDNHWRLEFWGRNIFNHRAWSILNNTTLQPGSISGYVSDPRTLGLTGTLSW